MTNYRQLPSSLWWGAQHHHHAEVAELTQQLRDFQQQITGFINNAEHSIALTRNLLQQGNLTPEERTYWGKHLDYTQIQCAEYHQCLLAIVQRLANLVGEAQQPFPQQELQLHSPTF